jgi:hypothetical protein
MRNTTVEKLSPDCDDLPKMNFGHVPNVSMRGFGLGSTVGWQVFAGGAFDRRLVPKLFFQTSDESSIGSTKCAMLECSETAQKAQVLK